MMRPLRSRNDQWSRLSVDDWRAMVNDSLDDTERMVGALGERLAAQNRILTSLLIAITTAAVVGSLNLIYLLTK